MKQDYIFHIQGMHCSSCVLLIEDALRSLPGVSMAKVSLTDSKLEISGDFSGSPEDIAEELSRPLKNHGYLILSEKIRKGAEWGDFIYAVPIASTLVLGFLALQKSGIAGLIDVSGADYWTAFLIGLVASVSTCLAVVGGLVLSLSASSAKENGTWRTQTLFHLGRLGGFFVLGGAIGFLGKSFQLGIVGSGILGILVALVMLVLGVNLLDVFHFTKRFQFTLPAGLMKYFKKMNFGHDHRLLPLFVGIGTFFLPCGFTQSMQIYALTTGSFLGGALTMTAFAAGTFPALALLSFGALNISHKPWKGLFFKVTGLIVIALALFNLLNAIVVAGIIDPLFNL